MNNSCEIIYVRQDDRIYLMVYEKIIRFLCSMFNIIRCNKMKDEKIIIVPKRKKYNWFARRIILNKVNKVIENLDNYYLVFDKNMMFLKEKFDDNKVLDGKMLMRKSIHKILNYIFVCNGQNMNLENVYVLVNKYTKQNIYLIRSLIPYFKTVNIITNDLKHFKLLENRLFNEGILITVSNNKRKGVKKARYIVNLDFQKEDMEMYTISSYSIIINCLKEKIVLSKGFYGSIINNIEVDLNADMEEYIKEFYGNIDNKLYCESYLIKCNWSDLQIENFDEKYGFKIARVYGMRGLIDRSEIYDNSRK